jgi:GNAT superfamily N-acetyltransferase
MFHQGLCRPVGLTAWHLGNRACNRVAVLLDDLHDVAHDFDCGTHCDRPGPGPPSLAGLGHPGHCPTGVGYWTAAEARGRGIASRCVQTATEWLFGGQDIMPADEIELLHTVGNEGSCRVAQKCGYVLESVLAPMPPKFPSEGHRHLRKRPA